MRSIVHPLGLPVPAFALDDEEKFRPDDPALAGETHAFILDRHGWFILRRSPISDVLERVGPPKDEPHYAVLTRRVPVEILDEAVAFFRAIYQKLESEVFAYIAINPGGGEDGTDSWCLLVPIQKVTGASVKFAKDQFKLYPGWFFAGTIHSHGRMNAFHSSVDDKDEFQCGDGIHITVGDLDEPRYSLACSLVTGGQRAKLEPSECFEGWEETATFPSEWLERVTKEEAQGFSGQSYNGIWVDGQLVKAGEDKDKNGYSFKKNEDDGKTNGQSSRVSHSFDWDSYDHMLKKEVEKYHAE